MASRSRDLAAILARHTDTSDPDACWLWGGFIDRYGYGRVAGLLAHRLTYTEAKGDIPDGFQIDHLCRVRRCVNPSHLEAVTPAVNNARMQAVRTQCKRGHEYTPENTLFLRNNRWCRICNRAAVARYAARKRAEAAQGVERKAS